MDIASLLGLVLAVAGILVEGDLLGHTTHGLQLLPGYLKEVESGSMRVQGEPQVIHETPAALTWNGLRGLDSRPSLRLLPPDADAPPGLSSGA